jgi:hypothetical protein
MSGAHLELFAAGTSPTPATSTAHIELTAGMFSGEGHLTAGLLPAFTQSATGTFTPPPRGTNGSPTVGQFAMRMAAAVAGLSAVAGCAEARDLPATLSSTFAVLVFLGALPRD